MSNANIIINSYIFFCWGGAIGKMKKRKILILILIICAVGIVFGSIVFGFSKASKESSVSYEQFMNKEDDEFQFMNIDWNSSVEIIQEKLPFDIKKVDIGSETSSVYQSEEAVDFEGNNGIASFEFVDGELKTIKFDFSHLQDEYKQWFDNQYKKLTKIYGKETKNQTGGGELFDSQIYTWEKNNTIMQLILLTGDSINPAVTFGVWTTR